MHRPAFVIGALVATSVLFSGAAGATPKTLKIDRFSDDPATAISEIQSAPMLECQPGFFKGEAYGVILVPNDDDYPFDILSIDLVQGDTGSADAMNDITIEIYNDNAIASVPSGPPIYVLTSGDVFIPPDTFGQPVVENTFMRYQFDPMSMDPADHPPKITSGNLRIVIQFDNPEVDLGAINPACAPGCQDPCAMTDDNGITPQRTVIHAQGDTWAYSEAFGVKNDWILRTVIDSNAGGSGQGGGSATSSTTAATGAGGAATTGAGTGGAEAVECNSDADCPSLNQLCRAHTCQASPDDGAAPTEDGGCGCRVGTSESSAGALAALLGLGLLARRRTKKA